MFSSRTLATLVLLASPITVFGQPPAKEGTLGREALSSIQDAARDLSREIEFLEEEIVSELTETKERTLFSQTEALLVSVESFRKSLKAEAQREEIYKSFDRLDEQLHKLLTAVVAIAKDHKILQRAASRVGWADDQLHHSLFMSESAEVRATQTLQRQARAMVVASARLDRAAEYSLAGSQGRAVLTGNLKKLSDSCQSFQKAVENKLSRDVLRTRFAEVTQAWQRVTEGMQDLKVGESSYLIHSAAQMDLLHESLYRIVGGKGDRPRLIIRT